MRRDFAKQKLIFDAYGQFDEPKRKRPFWRWLAIVVVIIIVFILAALFYQYQKTKDVPSISMVQETMRNEPAPKNWVKGYLQQAKVMQAPVKTRPVHFEFYSALSNEQIIKFDQAHAANEVIATQDVATIKEKAEVTKPEIIEPPRQVTALTSKKTNNKTVANKNLNEKNYRLLMANDLEQELSKQVNHRNSGIKASPTRQKSNH